VRGRDVGRVNEFGNFYAFEPGSEIIFDGHIYIPPFGTRQRQVPDVLGTHKLVLGDGYLIHGTNQETSVGDAVSHGCIRMYNEDVARLYEMVRPGTPVFIFFVVVVAAEFAHLHGRTSRRVAAAGTAVGSSARARGVPAGHGRFRTSGAAPAPSASCVAVRV
jgi:hypothetical protein